MNTLVNSVAKLFFVGLKSNRTEFTFEHVTKSGRKPKYRETKI